jgi:DNA polymerase-1
VLVTLDDKVKLEVPLADLAVHERTTARLIAFLKAMEFSDVTRAVADSPADAGAIDPRQRRSAAAPGTRAGARRGAPRRCRRLTAGHGAEAAPGRKPARTLSFAGCAGSRRRAEIARRSRAPRYEIFATSRRSTAGSRGDARGRSRSNCAPRSDDPMQADSAASRWRRGRTRPATCRSAIAQPDDLLGGGLDAGQIPREARRSRA